MAPQEHAGMEMVVQVMEVFSNHKGDSVSSITIICSSVSFAETGTTRTYRYIPVSLATNKTLNSAVRKSCLHN